MMNRVELKEEMMKQVNGGVPQRMYHLREEAAEREKLNRYREEHNYQSYDHDGMHFTTATF